MVLPALSLRRLAWALLGLGLLAGPWLWLSPGGLVAVAWQEGQAVTTGELVGPERIGQVFRCPAPNLSRIEVRLGTYGAWPTSPGEFTIAELPARPEAPQERLGPSDGRPLVYPPHSVAWGLGRTLVQLWDPPREGCLGVEFLIRKRPGATAGELALEVFPYGWEEAPPSLVVSRPVAELPAYGFVRFDLPPELVKVGRTLRLVLKEREMDAAALTFFWWPYPPPPAPLGLTPASRAWPGFKVAYTKDRAFEAFDPDLDERYIDGVFLHRLFKGELIFRAVHPSALGEAQVKARRTFSARWASDNAYLALDFPPQADSQGRLYLAAFSGPEARHQEALTLWAGPAAGPESFLLRDGVPLAGSLAFRAYAAVPRTEAWALFTRKIEAGRTWAGPYPTLVLLGGLAHLAAAGLILSAAGRLGRAGRPAPPPRRRQAPRPER